MHHTSTRLAVAFGLLLGAAVPSLAAERVLHLDPAATSVRFRVKARAHQVLGSIPFLSGEVRFDDATGEASGEIVLDVSRADTGIEMRNRTMREEVFEVAKYPHVVFRPNRLLGQLPDAGVGDLVLFGRVDIHGGEHEVRLPVVVEVAEGRLRATTIVEIPYVEWGMHNPGNAMLRVAETVEVRIDAAGTVQ
jgi:polyisoprenoid-binding protein YceI